MLKEKKNKLFNSFLLFLNKPFILQVFFIFVKQEKTILIVGLGAIGSVVYSRLDRKGYKVVCMTSKEGRKVIITKGLLVELVGENTPEVHTCEVYSEIPEKYEITNVIIATKSWLNEDISNSMKSIFNATSSVLFLQNGMNIEKPFLDKYENLKLSRALTSLAALREDVNHAKEANVGDTIIGGINYDDNEEIQFWKNLLITIGLPTEISTNIQKDVWLKTIINCSIGPLGAITGLLNGQLLEESSLNFLMRGIIEEILPIIPEELMINFYEAYNLLEKIINQTSEHKCSMLQDIENNQKTEIDTLNGSLIKLATKKGIMLPINSKLVEIVKKLSEESYPKELAILDLRSMF